MEQDPNDASGGGGGFRLFAKATAAIDPSSMQTGNSTHSGRRRRGPSDEDPLSEIMSKLGLGNEESGTTVSRQDEQQAVLVLAEVLQIEIEQAKFFLESSGNDVAKAVNLHFELSEGSKRARSGGIGGGSLGARGSRNHRWVKRSVEIAGLPEGWEASVSRTAGNIVFRHLESGHEQMEVPPGFADHTGNEDEEGSSAEIAPLVNPFLQGLPGVGAAVMGGLGPLQPVVSGVGTGVGGGAGLEMDISSAVGADAGGGLSSAGASMATTMTGVDMATVPMASASSSTQWTLAQPSFSFASGTSSASTATTAFSFGGAAPPLPAGQGMQSGDGQSASFVFGAPVQAPPPPLPPQPNSISTAAGDVHVHGTVVVSPSSQSHQQAAGSDLVG